MAVELEFVTHAAPEDVLRSVRKNAAYWQQSMVPKELWDAGIFGVMANVKRERFVLRTVEYSRFSAVGAIIVGRVVTVGDGRTLVRASARNSHYAYAVPALLMVLAIMSRALGGSFANAAQLAFVGFGFGFFRFLSNLAVTRERFGVGHLIERLEIAVRRAEQDA